MAIPKYQDLFNPTLQAIERLGGSASNQELLDEVAQTLGLTDEELAEQHPKGQPIFAYRLAWARSYLKTYGLLDNSERGIWALTAKGRETDSVDEEAVKRFVRAAVKSKQASEREDPTEDPEVADDDDDEWRGVLLAVLQKLAPSQFERLCQRILRESGFAEVHVTGRSGDGGIDGTGVVKLGGLLGFPILFQCKRYQGSVGAGMVRDFRGAMIGRADRGLIMTTGVFTRDARNEAARDGAPPVDLVDRDGILDKLKELHLGVRVDLVESISIETNWFESL